MNEAIVTKLAQEKLEEVDSLVSNLAAAETQLERGYAKLGCLLNEIQENLYWQGYYESYGEFLAHIQEVYGISKSQLYNYRAAAHDLIGSVTEEQMNQMGISKALTLRAAKRNNQTIPDDVIAKALDKSVTVEDLKQILFESHHIERPEDEDWISLDFSCYVSEEEKNTIQTAMKIAKQIDPPIAGTLPDHMQQKEILLRFAIEFLNTYDSGTYV